MKPLLVRAILLALLACRPGFGIDYVVDDFKGDYSGSPADTAKMDPGFGDTLKIVPKSFGYTATTPVFLSDSVGNNGQNGGSTQIAAVGRRSFRAAFVAWGIGHVFKAANDMNSPKADVVVRGIEVDEGVIRVDNAGLRIASGENINDPYLPKRQQDARAPTFFHYVADGNRFAGYWGSMDQYAFIRRSTHKEQAGGGDPATWGKHLLTAPATPLRMGGYGELGAAVVPGSGGSKTVLAYETIVTTIPPVSETGVRWEDLEAGTFESTTFTRNGPAYCETFVVAADTAGNTLVMWREADSLFVAAYNAARVQVQAPTSIRAGISYKDSPQDHWYRPYAAISTTNGNFLIAYTVGVTIYYRKISIPYLAQVYSSGTETALTALGMTANYPSIALNQSQVLFGWYRRAGAADSLVGALFNRQGSGIDAASRQDMPLTSETVAFNLPGPGWIQHHYYKAPAIAIDSAGNIAAAYDNQFWSKLSMTANFAVFWDSATFTSKPISTLSIPSVLPILATDSLEYVAARLVAKSPEDGLANVNVNLSLSRDGSFTDPGSAFGPFPAGQERETGWFKYRIDLKAAGPLYTTQTKVDSLILRYNVKPRRPSIDSLRIGAASLDRFDSTFAYSVMPRKDSIRMVVSGVDVDDRSGVKFFLFLGDQAIDSTLSIKGAPGRYRAVLALKPLDSLPSPLDLSIRTRDSSGWVSLPVSFRPEFVNRVPAETLTVVRNRGMDSLNVFRPSGGGADTLAPVASQLIVLQTGDTATANLRLGDPNDDTVTFRLKRNNNTVTTRRVAVKDLLTLKIAADTAAPLVDTLTALVFDANDTTAFRFLVRPNRIPALDSLYHASYKGRDSVRLAGPFDVVRNFAADSGIQVPSALPAVLKAGFSDRDLALGDGVRIGWSVFTPKVPFPAGCAAGNLACYDTTAKAAGDSIAHAFALPEEYVTVRATDSTGAFVERKVRLEYQIIDTSGAASFAAGLKALVESLDFIIGGKVSSDTITAEVTSLGNIPLQILSASTGGNDGKWLDLKFKWESPGTPLKKDSLSITGRTDSNSIKPGSPITVAPGAKMTMTFKVTSDSLRGDSVLVDTLVLRTNDLSKPMIRIPIRIAYNDLPVLRISNRGGATAAPGGYNDAGLPTFLPVRTSLVFAFSEPVRIPDPASRIRIYSYLDSLKNPSGHRVIPGSFEYRLRPASLARRSAGAGAAGGVFAVALRGASAMEGSNAAADSLADTLVFRPAYDRASDSLKVRPRAGAFIHRDVLHIEVDNGVTDRAGNPLDLRLDRTARAPNTVDTVFPVRVDTGFFRVVSTTPARGDLGWDPEKAIKVRFNRKLGIPPPQGQDSATFLDFGNLKGDSSKVLWAESRWRGERRYDLQFLSVEDGDSSLVFRTRPKFPAFDTVTVTLAGILTDHNGLTLDGNFDGFPSAFYDSADTADQYRFTFQVREQEFYIFPNPYRHSNARHREKGTITFKNINSLSGFVAGREVVLRVHSMTGDLIYSSLSAPRSRAADVRNWAIMEWDLRNNAGNLAGTGVYVYTLISGGTQVLRKGKVAVIR